MEATQVCKKTKVLVVDDERPLTSLLACILERKAFPVRQYESEEGCVNFPAIVLLHGKGGSPNGSVSQLEAELRVCEPNQRYIRPEMPHTDPAVMPSVSVQHLRSLGVHRALSS